MNTSTLSADAYRRALTLRDLTDERYGPHAMQVVLRALVHALTARWQCPAHVHRDHPVRTVADNYDALHYPPDAAARDARYSRYITHDLLLRTHTSSAIPGLLRTLSISAPEDLLLVCPGLVYRRDVIDRLHTGEPHQVDLWRVTRGSHMNDGDLQEMVSLVLEAALPGWRVRTTPSPHSYTVNGIQIDVEADGKWVEVGECGIALPRLLERSGLAGHSGLAMGLGLDRLLMLRKGMDDIRLLRSEDPRIADQMLTLDPYVPVSNQPAVQMDVSVAVDSEADEQALGDVVRESLGADANLVESVALLSETSYSELPPHARARLGVQPHQKNVLLRLVLRALDRTLTREEANGLRDTIYRAVHDGATPGYVPDPSQSSNASG